MKPITRSYIETALWSSSSWWLPFEGGNPPPCTDNYVLDDFAPAAVSAAEAVCESFATANAAAITASGQPAEQVGHDLWLTRNRHGAGFQDGGYGKQGDTLAKAAHALGESDIYLGDDGLLYFT